jgi:uncharacterized protein (TIGR02757 family)
MNPDKKLLKGNLERLYATFDRGFLSTDPLEFVHRYDDDADREVVGLIASALAYGRVAGIRKSVERVLAAVGPHPAAFTRRFTPDKGRTLFSGFVHRFNDGADISCLFWFARQMIEQSGSIGGFFMEGYDPAAESIRPSLASFSERVLSLDSAPVYGADELPRKAGVRFFFPSPGRRGAGASGCKRLNLYLRWMVRRGDCLDFGIWSDVSPSKLVIPVDTHIGRISRNIGLTERTTQGWKTAEEITASLRELDPEDPVRYDFALCRLGILDKCPRTRDLAMCESCMIRDICVL